MIKTYQKGVNFEREIVNQARKQGLIAFRAAGSKSGELPIDVCIIDRKKRIIRFIQAKAGKHPLKPLHQLRKLLQEFDDEYLVKFELLEKGGKNE